MLRWLTAGESHGPALMAVLEGLPAGVRVTSGEVADELARRRLGHGRGARMAFERDEVEFLGGLRHGTTQGGPVSVMVGNTEWPKWETVMSPDPVDPDVLAEQARNAPLTRPRPGQRRACPGANAQAPGPERRHRPAGSGGCARPGERPRPHRPP